MDVLLLLVLLFVFGVLVGDCCCGWCWCCWCCGCCWRCCSCFLVDDVIVFALALLLFAVVGVDVVGVVVSCCLLLVVVVVVSCCWLFVVVSR